MKKEQSIRKIGKLMLAISSCGVLLTAFQANESVFAEDATTTEATTTAAATTEATTEATTATTEATTEATTAAPTRAAKEANAKVTGTIKNHDIKNYEYYTDVDIAVSLTDDDVKEGDYVTITLENVAVLTSLNGKDVIYEGKKIGTISVVSFENVNKARQGSNDKAQMEQAELESTRITLKITFTNAVEAVKPDVLKQAQFQIKSDNAYNGAVIANKDYTLNQVIKVGDSSVTSTVDIPKVEKFATETNSIHFTPSGNTIKFNADGSYETSTQFQVRGSEGMKVGSTVATATIDGKDSKGIYIYRIISDSTSAQLVLDSLVTDYKDIDTQESIKATDKGWKDPATIDGYEFVKTEKDREGNRIHWYKKVAQPTTEVTTEETTVETTVETTAETTTSTPEEPKQEELPNTGVATTAVTTGLATLFAGLGLAVSKKKK